MESIDSTPNPTPHTPHPTPQTQVTSPYYNQPLSIRLFASNETHTRGFAATVSYVSRIDTMREAASATNLQFALATLEAQVIHNLRGQQMPSPRPWRMMKYFDSTVWNPG